MLTHSKSPFIKRLAPDEPFPGPFLSEFSSIVHISPNSWEETTSPWMLFMSWLDLTSSISALVSLDVWHTWSSFSSTLGSLLERLQSKTMQILTRGQKVTDLLLFLDLIRLNFPEQVLCVRGPPS